jgi:hypothetical protein
VEALHGRDFHLIDRAGVVPEARVDHHGVPIEHRGERAVWGVSEWLD